MQQEEKWRLILKAADEWGKRELNTESAAMVTECYYHE
jgi:hypothetical protein